MYEKILTENPCAVNPALWEERESLSDRLSQQAELLYVASSAREVASHYSRYRLNVIPVPERSKEAKVRWKEYQRRRTDGEIGKLFTNHSNIAIICGAISENLIVIDCESDLMFGWIQEKLNELEIDTWLVKTARGGHAYLRTDEPLRGVRVSEDIEIRAEGQYVLAPPSIHPSGTRYEFINRPESIAVVSDAQLSFLGAPLVVAVVAPRVPTRTRRLMADRLDNYPTKSEQDHAIIQGLVNAHFTVEQVRGELLTCDYKGHFRTLHEKDPSNAARWLQQNYDKCKSRGDSPTTVAFLNSLTEMKQVVNGMEWTGLTNATDRKVLMAHLRLSERAKSETYNASVRELAETAKVTIDTASNSNKRLIEDLGVIKREKRGSGANADTFRLCKDRILSFSTHTTQHMYGTCSEIEKMLLHELFSSRRLGRSSGVIFNFLVNYGPMTAKELNQRSGHGLATVYRVLDRMNEIMDTTGELHAIVECTDGRWCAVASIEQLDELARLLGLKQKWRMRRRQHEVERDNYRRRNHQR